MVWPIVIFSENLLKVFFSILKTIDFDFDMGYCLGLFSVVVLKHMTKNNLKREGFIWLTGRTR